MDDGSGEMNMGRTVTAPAEQRLDVATHAPVSRLIFPKAETNRPFHVRVSDRSLNVSLITEGTYPFHDGGVSVWCDQIVRGLAPDRFRIDAITAGLDDTACWMFPENVAEVRRIPLWGPDHSTSPVPAPRPFDPPDRCESFLPRSPPTTPTVSSERASKHSRSTHVTAGSPTPCAPTRPSS